MIQGTSTLTQLHTK